MAEPRSAGPDAAPPCPLCGEGGAARVGDHLDFRRSGIYFCAGCEHGFAHPEPDEAWLAEYYRKTYGRRRP